MTENICLTQKKHETLVLDALRRLGGQTQMRVMEFRKHIAEPLKESQIKKALKRLLESETIIQTNEKCDSRGPAYRIV